MHLFNLLSCRTTNLLHFHTVGEAEADEAEEGEEGEEVDATAVAVAKDVEPAVDQNKEQMCPSIAGPMAHAVIQVGSANVPRRDINTRRHSKTK